MHIPKNIQRRAADGPATTRSYRHWVIGGLPLCAIYNTETHAQAQSHTGSDMQTDTKIKTGTVYIRVLCVCFLVSGCVSACFPRLRVGLSFSLVYMCCIRMSVRVCVCLFVKVYSLYCFCYVMYSFLYVYPNFQRKVCTFKVLISQ